MRYGRYALQTLCVMDVMRHFQVSGDEDFADVCEANVIVLFFLLACVWWGTGECEIKYSTKGAIIAALCEPEPQQLNPLAAEK